MEKILIISPHIDDAEFAMGGTLLKYRDNGSKIILAITHSDDSLGGDVSIRRVEQESSAEIIGAECIFIEGKMLVEKKVAILDKINPDILYCPHENDTHQDHVEASRIGLSVSRNFKISVLFYLNQRCSFCFPNYLNVIDIERKKELVSVFKSQNGRQPKFMEIMVAQNRYFGSLVSGNGHYAEGFVVHRMVNL